MDNHAIFSNIVLNIIFRPFRLLSELYGAFYKSELYEK